MALCESSCPVHTRPEVSVAYGPAQRPGKSVSRLRPSFASLFVVGDFPFVAAGKYAVGEIVQVKSGVFFFHLESSRN